MEFSNPDKHTNLTGPIGSNKKTVPFGKEFSEVENFKDLVDFNRINYIDNSTIFIQIKSIDKI